MTAIAREGKSKKERKRKRRRGRDRDKEKEDNVPITLCGAEKGVLVSHFMMLWSTDTPDISSFAPHERQTATR